MDFAFPHKIIHMKYLWKCIICVPSQNNKYLLSVYFAFPHKIIHMESMRRPRLKVLTGLEYHLPLNRPQGPSIELLCVLFYLHIVQGPLMVQNFPQTSLQTAKTSLQTAKTSLQTSKTRLFFLFSFFATEYLFTCLFRNGCSLSGTSHSFVARAHIVRRCAPIHVISHSPYSFATWLL